MAGETAELNAGVEDADDIVEADHADDRQTGTGIHRA